MYCAREAAMSSSRIYKGDPLFTPTTLVQGIITLPTDDADLAAMGADGSTDDQFVLDEPQNERSGENPERQEDHGIEPVPPLDLQALREEAYNQGMADMAALHQSDFQAAIEAFAACCQKLDNQRKALLEQSRGDMINLIVAVTRKIIGQELATPRNLIATTLQTALENAIDSEEYYVTLHPDDLAFAEQQAPEIISSIRGLERLVFKTNSSISRGGVPAGIRGLLSRCHHRNPNREPAGISGRTAHGPAAARPGLAHRLARVRIASVAAPWPDSCRCRQADTPPSTAVGTRAS